MKTELKAKLLQNILRNKKKDEGFTLIELLVVIIIIGILSAIALPSFLNQANKAKQSEAKTIIGSMNRAQQTYYLENNRFANADDFGGLGLGVRKETENYTYTIKGGGRGEKVVTNQAQLLDPTAALKAYIGGVVIGTIEDTNEATTLAVLCEGDKAGSAEGKKGTEEVAFDDEPSCPDGYKDLSGNTNDDD
jgi:prepilin-type N-terminal cleavage/methylation domain-containing protein